MSVADPGPAGPRHDHERPARPARPQDPGRRRRCASRAPGAPTPSSTSGSPGWPARCSDRGVGTGDRVAVLALNGMEAWETYLAGVRLGAIVVPVNFRLVADEVAYVLADSRRDRARRRRRAGRGRGQGARAGARRRDGARRSARSSRRRSRRPATEPLDVVVDEDEPAFIMYTSGHDRPAEGRRADPPQPAACTCSARSPTSAGTPRTGSPPPAPRCSTSPAWRAACPRCWWAAPT